MNHEDIKQRLISEAKSAGISTTDMRILSTDPFFVGTQKDYTDAKWAASLWDQMMNRRKKALHLRGFHYWVQSQGIAKPDGDKYSYKDPAKDWGYLLHSVQMARYLGIGTWQNLVDMKHPDPVDFDNYWIGSGMVDQDEVNIQEQLNNKLENIVNEFIRELMYNSPKYHDDGYQMYHMEVMCEKNSMGFVIEPACRKYNACYQAFVGQASVEKINLMAERAMKAARNGKKVRLFYIADWDRYGWSMVTAVARKIEFMTQDEEDMDIKLTRLALNEDQVDKYNLPKAPKHGEAVVELDALEAIHPGALGDIIEAALKPYYDAESPKIVREENRRIRDSVRDILEKKLREPLQKAFENIDIESIAEEVDIYEAVDKDFEVPEPDHEFDDEDVRTWVYYSKRPYWEQWNEYKKYKGERQEEAA